MPTPHPHCEFIKAWADGKKIQYFSPSENEWLDIVGPSWCNNLTYRVKPEPKPDIVVNAFMQFKEAWKRPSVYSSCNGEVILASMKHLEKVLWLEHIRFIFDGETNKLKSVEIIK